MKAGSCVREKEAFAASGGILDTFFLGRLTRFVIATVCR